MKSFSAKRNQASIWDQLRRERPFWPLTQFLYLLRKQNKIEIGYLEDAKLDISEEQAALWAVRANCCFDQIDNLLSAQTISDLTSISNAITKGDVSFLNEKMPSLQAISTTQLKLASLTGLRYQKTGSLFIVAPPPPPPTFDKPEAL